MQSSLKVLEGIISKIKSPLSQIRNRAVTTLYTKVLAKIITESDLTKSTELPGVLFYWINQTTPANKDCLYKVLSILHRFTFSEQGINLLLDYEALEFLEQFRKYLLSNETNVDEHMDIIKKIIKQILPMQRHNQTSKQTEKEQKGKQNSQLEQQEAQSSDDQTQQHQKDQNHHKNERKQKTNKNQSKRQRNIMTFYCLNDDLPKAIDEQLYGLIIQLKHGKKPSTLQTLTAIQEIINFWGSRYFKYKQDLFRQLVCVIEGKIYSEVSLRILSKLLKQLLQMQQDLGLNASAEVNSDQRNYMKTSSISQKSSKNLLQKLEVEIKFQIFKENPFSYIFFDTIILKNKAETLSGSVIEYLLIAVQRFSFSALFLPSLLEKIHTNSLWMAEGFVSKFFQEQFLIMVNHCCQIQANIYSQIIPFLQKFFPGKSLEQLSRKIPNLSIQLQQEQISKSFQILTKYTSKERGLNLQSFDFNLELHQLQTHVKNLEKGLSGLPKNPQIISLYIDCMLMLAVSVAKQDALMSFYPKIKSLVLKISQHQFSVCRIVLYDKLLLTFNSSEKINYLAQSYLKSEIIRLVFTDSEFYMSLLKNSLNQQQTIGSYLEITKLIQSTTKQENHKFLNKIAPIFYILSFHSGQDSKNSLTGPSISAAGKVIISRIQKKYQVVNILMTMFLKSKEQRMKTYINILGLSGNQDLLKIVIETNCRPQKKSLKYSLSTIRNYMNIIMSQKIQSQIKASAIDQMIECVQRIDLSSLEKDEELLAQINKIHNSIEIFIKAFLQKPSKSQQIELFIQLVRIYSILQKRLRLSTNYLNQSIRSLAPQIYLNILINICGSIKEDNLHGQNYLSVIAQFMTLLYYHCFTTFSSDLLVAKEGQHMIFNSIKVHWITKMFPHEAIIKSQYHEIQSIGKRVQFSQPESSQKVNKQKQKLIQSYLKGYRTNFKSFKQLINLYVKKINSKVQNEQAQIQLKRSILCPILERQLSNAIHNLNSNQNQLCLLNFLFDNFATISSKFNVFEPLQEIVPHLMNQLIKPNVPAYVKIVLINICNAIGWKRTKQFEGLMQQINCDQLYYLNLLKNSQKISVEQLGKIIKTGLANIQNIKISNHMCTLFHILLKPANLKTLVSSATQYTQLLVLNSLIKCMQNPNSDKKVINLSAILLYQIIREVLGQVSTIHAQKIVILNSDFDDQDVHRKRTVQIANLISSLSIGQTIMGFAMEQFQGNCHSSGLSLQNFCFFIQVLKVNFKISNFVFQNQLIPADMSLSHENKLVKLFLVRISEYLRSNTQFMGSSSIQMLYTSVFNLVSALLKTSSFNQTAYQIDLLDLSLTLLHQKVKYLSKNDNKRQINKSRVSQTLLLFASIFQYTYLRIQSDPCENSHYLLSSTSFLQSAMTLFNFLRAYITDSLYKSQNQTVYIKQILQKMAKVILYISSNQEDYFLFKLNNICQQAMTAFDIFQTLGNLVESADDNFLIMFMRIILIWDGQKQTSKNTNKNLHQILNSADIFEESDQQDDSSIEQRQLYQKPKHPFQNNWIYKVVTFAVQKNYIKHCKSLLALSLPAKMFLIQKTAFMQYLKRVSHLIDNKIVSQTNLSKKKTQKKNPNGNSSVMLSNSRRTVLSQAHSHIQEESSKNFSEQQKLSEIEQFLKISISLFAINENLSSSDKVDIILTNFTIHLNKFKESLRKLFYNVDKLYTLSQVLTSNSINNRHFSDLFLRMITSLSESKTFSLPLSNHLTQIASPMLEQSISTVLKGISMQLNQHQYEKLKQALKLLTTLSNHQSVRSYIYKNKLIEELNLKIIRYEQKKTDRTDFINLNSLYDIVCFYLNLSKFKDSHSKILNDKKVLQVFINQVYMQKSNLLSEKLLSLLGNLCAYKSNKTMFMQNREIHKTILGQLESEQIEYKCILLTLLYNLIYRHAPAVKLYKRKDVIQMLNAIPWEKCDNWDNVKHIHAAVFEVLESQSEIPDKS